MKEENSKWVSASEAAKMLSVTDSAIRNYAKMGLLTYKLIGGSDHAKKVYRFSVESIEKLLQSDIVQTENKLEEYKSELKNEIKRLNELRAETTAFYKAHSIIGPMHIFDLITQSYKEEPNLLGEREWSLTRDYLSGEPIESMSKRFGLTQSRIRQLLTRAFYKWKARMGSYDNLKKQVEELSKQLKDKKLLEQKFILLEKKFNSMLAYINANQDTGQCSFKTPEQLILPDLVFEPLWEQDFSTRALNVFRFKCINTVYDLLKLNRDDFKHLRNVGTKTVEEIEKWIQDKGLTETRDLVLYHESIKNKYRH